MRPKPTSPRCPAVHSTNFWPAILLPYHAFFSCQTTLSGTTSPCACSTPLVLPRMPPLVLRPLRTSTLKLSNAVWSHLASAASPMWHPEPSDWPRGSLSQTSCVQTWVPAVLKALLSDVGTCLINTAIFMDSESCSRSAPHSGGSPGNRSP